MFAALLLIFFLTGNDMLPLEIEPKCTSKFDFEEKLLEKVIRMEVKLETLTNKVEKDLLKFDKGVESLNLEFQKLSEIRDLALKKDVVFHVKDIAAQPTANNVIKFTNVVINTGNVYNLDTGFFTAPKNGTYWFSAQICTHTNRYISPSIHVAGVVMNRIYTKDNDGGDCSTVNAVAVLQTGETVTLKAGPNLSSSPVWSSDNYNSNNFMGVLIN